MSSLASLLLPVGANASERQEADATTARQLSIAEASVELRPTIPHAQYDPIIEEAALRHGVSASLVRAVVKVESNFKADARSPKGALGLMQLLPSTALELGATALFDPHTNINAGTRHLKHLLTRYAGSAELALAAYNAGEGAVERYGRTVPPYPETQAYVKKVLAQLGPTFAANPSAPPGRGRVAAGDPDSYLKRAGAIVEAAFLGGVKKSDVEINTRRATGKVSLTVPLSVQAAQDVVGGVWTNMRETTERSLLTE